MPLPFHFILAEINQRAPARREARPLAVRAASFSCATGKKPLAAGDPQCSFASARHVKGCKPASSRRAAATAECAASPRAKPSALNKLKHRIVQIEDGEDLAGGKPVTHDDLVAILLGVGWSKARCSPRRPSPSAKRDRHARRLAAADASAQASLQDRPRAPTSSRRRRRQRCRK